MVVIADTMVLYAASLRVGDDGLLFNCYVCCFWWLFVMFLGYYVDVLVALIV